MADRLVKLDLLITDATVSKCRARFDRASVPPPCVGREAFARVYKSVLAQQQKNIGPGIQAALGAGGTLRVLVWRVLKDGWRSEVILQGYAMSMVS